MTLTPEQVWLFRLAGFVKLPESLAPPTVAALKAAIQGDIDRAVEPVVRNGEGRIVRLSNVLGRAPLPRGGHQPLVLEPLADLLGPDVELVRNRHNHATLRLPDPRAEQLHRDVPQWTRGLVTVLCFLEESTCERGCTQLVPGSHLLPWAPDPAAAIERGRLAEQVVRAEMPAGGLLVIDSLLWHGVGPNRTGQTRMSMTLGYHSVDDLASVDDPQRVLVRGQRRHAGHSY